MAQLASTRRESLSAAGTRTATGIDPHGHGNSGTAAPTTEREEAGEPTLPWQTPFGMGRQMLETSMRLRAIWVDGMGSAMQAQLAYLQGVYDDAIRCRDSLLAAEDAEDRNRLMLDYARDAIERGFANWITAAQLAARPANEIIEALARQAEPAVQLPQEVGDRAA